MNYNIHQDFWTKINGWFFNTVYRSHEGNTVIKVPKITSWLVNQTHTNILRALDIHQDFLWERLPETKISLSKQSPLWYVFEQEYVDGVKTTINDLKGNWDIAHNMTAMMEAGELMQKKTKLYFDPYGMNDYIKNTYKIISHKNIVFGNIVIDKTPNIHYIDVGYIRTDRLGIANNILTQIMHNLIAIK